MKVKILTINFLIFVFVNSCHKKVNSDFVLNKYEYKQGEMIEITNLNSKKKNQIWEIIDPYGTILETKKESDPQFLINILGDNGMYTINLYDNDKEKEKDLKKSNNFIVKSQKGELYIHCSHFGDNSFSAYVDGQFIGNDNDGELNVLLPEGLNFIEVFGRFDTIRKTIDISVSNSSTIWF